jgi:hypothetical protein
MQYINIRKFKETLLLQPFTNLVVLYGLVKRDKTLASRFPVSVFTRSLQYRMRWPHRHLSSYRGGSWPMKTGLTVQSGSSTLLTALLHLQSQ